MLAAENYNRELAISYANEWAYSRNPKYMDFHNLGGDCTNFISQCIFAGCKIMNYTPVNGWYYLGAENRAPSWTGVPFLYQFLTANKGPGPYAQNVSVENILPGDVIQLGRANGEYYHTLFIVETSSPPSFGGILVATHSYDANRRPLSTYRFQKIRFLHIIGARAGK
ncbi:MAG: amidase domain-containing protein [Bacillota bacterium]|nr:amidase domain-containing protein [Bacillota bacterium]